MAARLALALGTGALVLGLAGSAQPSPSASRPVNGRIVYEARGLDVVSADGTGRTRIAGTSASDHNPVWSPDGRRIAFERTRRSGDLDVYVMDGNGSGVRQLTFVPSFDADAAWYPDGQQLAFESNRAGGEVDVWRTRVDGRSQTRLTTSPAFDGDPAVSPDGTRIAFTSERDGNREISVAAAPGDDTLVGGYDRDVLLGEGGADLMSTRDRARDLGDGGPGRDRARVDPRLDRVRAIEARL